MIVDDVEGFLKFLDDVSFQLACLLDIDEPRQQRSGSGIVGDGVGVGRRANNSTPKKVYNRRKEPHRTNKSKSNQKSKNEIPSIGSMTNSNKRQPTKLQQSTRAKGKRKVVKLDDLLDDIHLASHARLTTSLTSTDSDALLDHNNQQHHLMHQHQPQQQHQTIHPSLDSQHQLQTDKLQHQHSTNSMNPTSLDAHTLDGQLTLNIADELPLDHVTSISPTTHLSPMDPTIQFNNLHSQHYYNPTQRGVGHLDSYHLHDDFATSHDQIPITNQTQNLNQAEQQRQHIVNHQHLISHHTQPTSALRVDSLADVTTALNSNDCYPHSHHIHHHHNPRTPQYHQLDQQWLAAAPHGSDNTLQLGQADSSTLDHVVPISPTSHQSLDQVQFNTPIYHHSYYNHQVEQLDSFHQMADDYATNTGPSIAVSSSSPLNHLHRMQQDQQQQQQQQHQQHQQHHHQSHNQHQSVLRMSTLDLNNSNNINSSSNNSNNNNNYDPHQIHHHQQHQHQRQQQQQHTLHSQPEHQIHGHNQPNNYSNNQTSHHQHNQHLNHQQHQMIPLMNGLVEPSGVIIQDINLASATWSSPEDLYSI